MKIKDFIKKYKWLILVLMLIPIVAILAFVIDEYFLHQIDMKAGEWAAFIGAVLSYIGTVLLGLLAFWQNQKVMELNEKLMKISKTNEMPLIELCEVSIERRRNPNGFMLSCRFQNIGKNASIYTTFWDPIFKTNKGERIQLKSESRKSAETLFMPLNKEITLEYIYDNYSPEKLNECQCIFQIFTTDLNYTQRKNHIVVQIFEEDSELYAKIKNYYVEESKEQLDE